MPAGANNEGNSTNHLVVVIDKVQLEETRNSTAASPGVGGDAARGHPAARASEDDAEATEEAKMRKNEGGKESGEEDVAEEEERKNGAGTGDSTGSFV